MVRLDFNGTVASTESGEEQREMLQQCFAQLQSEAPLPEQFYDRLASLVMLGYLVGKGEGIAALGADVKEMIHTTLKGIS